MKARSKLFLDRAVAAMVAAVEIYNKPDFKYRAESFTILAANAWELLLKAKWLADHNNRVNCLYVRHGAGTKRKRIKKTHAGNPMTFSLIYLARKLRESRVLPEPAFGNLEILSEMRDSAVHFYHSSQELAERLQAIATAAVTNFHTAMRDWFEKDLSDLDIYLMPLAFVKQPQCARAIVISTEEKRLFDFISSVASHKEDPSSLYSVAVNVELHFVRSKEKDAVPVRVTNDNSAPAVRLTEEQVRDRYPWDYQELTRRCRDRYADFKVNAEYHTHRKRLVDDSRFAHVRRLDPQNPNSSKKVFYNPNILRALDNYYSVNRNTAT